MAEVSGAEHQARKCLPQHRLSARIDVALTLLVLYMQDDWIKALFSDISKASPSMHRFAFLACHRANGSRDVLLTNWARMQVKNVALPYGVGVPAYVRVGLFCRNGRRYP